MQLLASLKSLLELVNTSAGINKLLLTGEEGMALRANFNSHFSANCGLCCNSFTTSALNYYLFVIGMDSCLHYIYTSLYNTKYSQLLILYHNFLRNARVF